MVSLNHKKIMKKYIMTLFVLFLFMLSSCKIKDMDQKFDDVDYITSNSYQTVYVGKVETMNKVSFKSFSGSDLITTIYSGDQVGLTIDREITDGRFKIVMVSSTNEITELKDGTYDYHAADGTVKIKIIGDEA